MSKSKPSAEATRSAPADREIAQFRLYVANETPNSVRAIANLQAICQQYLRDRCKIEIVDILQEPLRALSEGVLVTPTLVRLSPPPVRTIVGDLGNRSIVLHALGLETQNE